MANTRAQKLHPGGPYAIVAANGAFVAPFFCVIKGPATAATARGYGRLKWSRQVHSKPKPWFLWGLDPVVHDLPESPCVWPDCHEAAWANLPLCLNHAGYTYAQVGAMVRDRFDILKQPAQLRPAPPGPDPVVYYLMIGPATVKIGMTTKLVERIRQLRSEMQYIIALEPGGADLEHQRHKEFAAERHGRREDFHLSDRLKAHIESLQPQRDELIELAAQPGGYRVA